MIVSRTPAIATTGAFSLEEIESYAKSTSPGFGISTNRRHKTIPWTTSVNVRRRFSRKILCRALA